MSTADYLGLIGNPKVKVVHCQCRSSILSYVNLMQPTLNCGVSHGPIVFTGPFMRILFWLLWTYLAGGETVLIF